MEETEISSLFNHFPFKTSSSLSFSFCFWFLYVFFLSALRLSFLEIKSLCMFLLVFIFFLKWKLLLIEIVFNEGFYLFICILGENPFCFRDFQGFLNDLQDWELLKDTDKKMKKKSLASDLVNFQFNYGFSNFQGFLLEMGCRKKNHFLL